MSFCRTEVDNEGGTALITCLILLSTVHASLLPEPMQQQSTSASRRGRAESPLSSQADSDPLVCHRHRGRASGYGGLGRDAIEEKYVQVLYGGQVQNRQKTSFVFYQACWF
ncbi:glial cell line-derived neurotrophic factor-like protein [Lates japonicus]|uniref:Glial cell line-derived neurotrophic factor-like protein n=1 Tax=Lates japonicus TaxID=270547 RepID=A0AAD3MHI4_LATJO|nr:glial cell line-derived neurotrophic factor-like protein [Lates japonicus]